MWVWVRVRVGGVILTAMPVATHVFYDFQRWCGTNALKAEARPGESIREKTEARAVNGKRERILSSTTAPAAVIVQ